MLSDLIKELRVLAESILDENETHDLESNLEKSRELYEKLLILRHLENQNETIVSDEKEIIEELSKEESAEPPVQEIIVEPTEELPLETVKEEKPAPVETEKIEEPVKEEEDAPLSLNDLFVPTFDGIKEDFSQKEEFKDTVSLDETENMFEVKKEAPRQLSLNDKLVGNSIQVGLNDRIAFVNKLFNFSQSDFNKALSRLNECKTKEEALKYFQYQVKPNYNWKGKEDLEERLVSLIERKFM